MGMLAALHEANTSGEGQVVDCAMTDGVASLMSMVLVDVGNASGYILMQKCLYDLQAQDFFYLP